MKARLEVSLQGQLLAKAHALFLHGLKEMRGVMSRFSLGNYSFPCILGKCRSQIYPRRRRLCGKRLDHQPPVVSAICTIFSDALFETMVTSS